MMAQSARAFGGASATKEASLEEVHGIAQDVIEPGFGFDRGVTDGSTVASLGGGAGWSRMVSNMSWQDGFQPEHGSDEHPCISDEHPCTWQLDEDSLGWQLTDEEALERALGLVERLQRTISEHSRLEVSYEVALEFDQAWKAELNHGLRPLRSSSPAVAATLMDIVPQGYMTQDGDLIYLKVDHLPKIAEAFRIALQGR